MNKSKVKLLPEGGLLYVSIKQEHPKFFIAYPHDIHPFTHSLIMTSILLYTKTSLIAISPCTNLQKRCKFLMTLIFKKGNAVLYNNCIAFCFYSRWELRCCPCSRSALGLRKPSTFAFNVSIIRASFLSLARSS